MSKPTDKHSKPRSTQHSTQLTTSAGNRCDNQNSLSPGARALLLQDYH